MLRFQPFSIAELQNALPLIRKNPSLCSDLSAGYLYMWHDGADIRFCLWHDTLTIRQNVGEQPAFSYPVGADPDGMIDELIGYARHNHLPLRFFAADERTLGTIRADDRLRSAMWAYERRWSDYIYSFEDAMSFPGKKFGGERNHVNRFRKLYGEPDIRILTSSDRPDVEGMLGAYDKEHPVKSALERLELEQTGKLFDAADALGLTAAGLFISGELAAFSIGEIIGEMLIIHAEKALVRYEGIYPVMYSGFVRLIRGLTGKTLKYVNREDDSGDPGLRTSKLQYHPLCLAHKYLVHVNSPAARMKHPVTLSSGGVVLTDIRESDRHAYFLLNTDIENNRWWGYDYREDPSLPDPANENAFYDSVLYDMQAGDSVNFAVRLSEDGEMIGEAILWNFTSDGSAELGCRIMPACQGKGYGKAAFGAAADFAERFLQVRVFARCFRENRASRRMITANGFSPVREDRDSIYFERTAGRMPVSR